MVSPPIVYVDDRAGSGSSKDLNKKPPLVSYPPLNICQDCGALFSWIGKSFVCASGNKSHSSTGQLCRLESGDVALSGNGPNDTSVWIGVELKSLGELISSADTGRLQGAQVGQIPRMLTEYGVVWLLYYGTYRPGPSGELQIRRGKMWQTHKVGSRAVPYGYVESFLFTLSALGVRAKRVYDVSEAAMWIGCLARWWGKEWKDHKGMRTFDKTKELSEAAYLRVLAGLSPDAATVPMPVRVDDREFQRAKTAASLPSIGFEKAVAAAKHFASVRAMVNAPAAEWAKVPGIGKVVGRVVEEAVK